MSTSTELPKFKLLYYDKRANAEAIRFLLAYGNIEFDDERISKEQWLDMKEDTEFGVLPIVYINDEAIDKTISVCRYIGNLVGLDGDNVLENLRIDSIVEHINDLRQFSDVSQYNMELACTPKREQLKHQLELELFPFYLDKFNSIVTKEGYIANSKCTWADVYLVAFLGYAVDVFEDSIIKNFSGLKNLILKIHSLHGIKEWLAKRPFSKY